MGICAEGGGAINHERLHQGRRHDIRPVVGGREKEAEIFRQGPGGDGRGGPL